MNHLESGEGACDVSLRVSDCRWVRLYWTEQNNSVSVLLLLSKGGVSGLLPSVWMVAQGLCSLIPVLLTEFSELAF